ncbi:MAG: GNAT family N-acetyltransferase [Pyrinomonadaceae bacterium]
MLETERLRFRKLTWDDLDEMVEMRSDPDVARYMGGEKIRTREFNETRLKFYLECYDKFGFGMMATIYKPDDKLIGWSGLQPLEDTGEVEVGYGMIKKYWGRGIGEEAARAWLDYGFRVANLERIVAVASPENTGSWRIMEKCGMKYEKTEKHYGENLVFYAVARDEFLLHNALA